MSQERTLFSLTVTHRLRELLTVIATWAKIIAIAGFVGLPFELWVSIKDKELVTGIISAVASFILSIYLLNFSNKVKRALEATDQYEFNDSMSDLRKYFRFVAIFIILLVATSVVAMFWAISRSANPGF